MPIAGLTGLLYSATPLEPNVTMIDVRFVSTATDLPGYRATRNLGVVRGIVVRSRSIVGTIGASLRTLLGGNITLSPNFAKRRARMPIA